MSKNQMLYRLPGVYLKLEIQLVNGHPTINSKRQDYQIHPKL